MVHAWDLPVSQKSMKLNNGLLFLQAELSSFYIRSQIISPPKSATLSTSSKPCQTNPSLLIWKTYAFHIVLIDRITLRLRNIDRTINSDFKDLCTVYRIGRMINNHIRLVYYVTKRLWLLNVWLILHTIQNQINK